MPDGCWFVKIPARSAWFLAQIVFGAVFGTVGTVGTVGTESLDEMTNRTASCACGAVTIKVRDEPATVSMCHCLQCQKRTGSTYSVHAYYAREALTIAGERSSYTRAGDTGCFITFRFCSTCASTTDCDVEAMPDVVGVPVGLFADPDFPAPTVSIFVPHKHPWVAVPDDVPQNPGHSDGFLSAAQATLHARQARSE
jgi:hypothetical protein